MYVVKYVDFFSLQLLILETAELRGKRTSDIIFHPCQKQIGTHLQLQIHGNSYRVNIFSVDWLCFFQ